MTTSTMSTAAYMRRKDIARELGVSYSTASRIFSIADGIDTAQLGAYRVERRVRRCTVDAVVQINNVSSKEAKA